jgi:RNA polymerase sigma-70 factor (ECF subfamily)
VALDAENLYRRYGPMVLRRCRALLRDEERAVEAMQDVFVAVLRYGDRLDDHAPSSLLYRMATNTCLNQLRSRRRRPEDTDAELIDRIAQAPEGDRGAMRRLLEQIFAAEQESTRVMAVLHLVDGLTLEEVAAETGLSVSGVRKRLRTLKAHVAELEALS